MYRRNHVWEDPQFGRATNSYRGKHERKSEVWADGEHALGVASKICYISILAGGKKIWLRWPREDWP